MNPKKLLLGCGVVLMTLFAQLPAFGQCSSKVELVKTTIPSQGQKNGKLEVRVNAHGSYSIQLFSVTSKGEKLLSSDSGSGNKSHVFNNLDGDLMYNVRVEYSGEDKFLCKSKALIGIFLTDKQ